MNLVQSARYLLNKKNATFASFFSLILPFLLFCVLVFLGSFAHPLWGDEAETALFARNILKFGVLRGWDGVNIIGLDDAVVLNRDLINHMEPPLQYYITALSFLLFKESAFSARFPFIIFSVLSLILFYDVSIRFTKSKKISIISFWIICFSIGFILLSYQSRYYSVTVFAGLLIFRSLLQLPDKKIYSKLTFICGSILFFYAHYVSFIAFYIALLVSYITYLITIKVPDKEIKEYILTTVKLSLIIFAFCLPWYILQNPIQGRGSITISLSNIMLQGYYIYNIFDEVNNANIFPILFSPLIIAFLYKRTRKNYILLFLVLFPLLFLITLMSFNIITKIYINLLSFRYIAVILPFFFLLNGYLIYEILHWKRPVGIVLLFLYLFTNFFTLQKPRSFIFEYINEVLHPYKTSDELVANFLKEHAQTGQTVFVTLDRSHEVLNFLLKDSLKFVNRITPDNPRLFPENKKTLPKYIYSFDKEPDWVIVYGKSKKISFWNLGNREIPPFINLEKNYKEFVIPVLFASDIARPEISARSFSEIKPDKVNQVFIYKKVK